MKKNIITGLVIIGALVLILLVVLVIKQLLKELSKTIMDLSVQLQMIQKAPKW